MICVAFHDYIATLIHVNFHAPRPHTFHETYRTSRFVKGHYVNFLVQNDLAWKLEYHGAL